MLGTLYWKLFKVSDKRCSSDILMYTNRLPFHADVSIKQYSFLTKQVYSGSAVLSEHFSMFGEHQREHV